MLSSARAAVCPTIVERTPLAAETTDWSAAATNRSTRDDRVSAKRRFSAISASAVAEACSSSRRRAGNPVAGSAYCSNFDTAADSGGRSPAGIAGSRDVHWCRMRASAVVTPESVSSSGASDAIKRALIATSTKRSPSSSGPCAATARTNVDADRPSSVTREVDISPATGPRRTASVIANTDGPMICLKSSCSARTSVTAAILLLVVADRAARVWASEFSVP